MLTILSAQQMFDHGLFELQKPLVFDPGLIYNLTGPNGCGKTTLLELMAHIQRGEVKMLLGDQVLGHRDAEYCSKICYVSVHDPLPDIKVKDFLAQQEESDVLGMSALLNHRIKELSTGEKQLLRLLPLVQEKKSEFIYLDEPFNGLDATRIKWLRKRLSWLADHGSIVVYTSHILNDLEQEVACDQCIKIHPI